MTLRPQRDWWPAKAAVGGGSSRGRETEAGRKREVGRVRDRMAENRLPSASAGQGKPPESLGRRRFRGSESGLRTPAWVFVCVSPGSGLAGVSPQGRLLCRP